MAFVFSKQYAPEAQAQAQSFFKTLSERDQRRFAAVEAKRLGRGGIEYIAGVLGCSTRTIGRGIDELERLPEDPAAGRVRRPGGGRKKELRPNRNSNAI